MTMQLHWWHAAALASFILLWRTGIYARRSLYFGTLCDKLYERSDSVPERLMSRYWYRAERYESLQSRNVWRALAAGTCALAALQGTFGLAAFGV